MKNVFLNLFTRIFGILNLKVTTAYSPSGFFRSSPSCQIDNISELYEVFLTTKLDGVFVEVGAFDGYTFSNTWGLAQRGWRGIYVEPIPKYANQCRKNHVKHRNVSVVEKIVSSTTGDKETIFLAGTLSTTSTEQLESYRLQEWSQKHVSDKQIVVTTTTLHDLLETENVNVGFDLLVVDVEGTEDIVFSGFDIAWWKPKMIIVELEEFHPNMRDNRFSHTRLRDQIEDSGYSIVYKDQINTVFIDRNLYLEFSTSLNDA